MTLSGDCIELKKGMQVYVAASHKVKVRTIGEIINEYKICYNTPDEDGYIGAKASCCFIDYDAAIAYIKRELS